MGLICMIGCGGGSGSAAPPPPEAITISPMALTIVGVGTAQAVNAREWILVARRDRFTLQLGLGQVVLPPDAGPDAGPVPRPGCPLTPPGDAGCEADGIPLAIGETDWLYGHGFIDTPSRGPVPIPQAFGPAGEAIGLVSLGFGEVEEVRVGPGPLFFGLERTSLDGRTPMVWRTPGTTREPLPYGGFTDGPQPEQSDAQARIVGSGIVPQAPVLWVSAGDGWRLEHLPLLDGDSRGGAHGIDDDMIVGWSADDGGARHAVAWTSVDSGWTPAALPVPAEFTACQRAVGIGGGRIVGECSDADANVVGVVWQRRADALTPVATLAPHAPGAQVEVVGISGTLVVGNGSTPVDSVPIAWRLPPNS